MKGNEIIDNVVNNNKIFSNLHHNFHDLVNKQIRTSPADENEMIRKEENMIHSKVVMLLCHEIESLRLKLEMCEQELKSFKEKNL